MLHCQFAGFVWSKIMKEFDRSCVSKERSVFSINGDFVTRRRSKETRVMEMYPASSFLDYMDGNKQHNFWRKGGKARS